MDKGTDRWLGWSNQGGFSWVHWGQIDGWVHRGNAVLEDGFEHDGGAEAM